MPGKPLGFSPVISLPNERCYFSLPVPLRHAHGTVRMTRLFVTSLLKRGVLVPGDSQSGVRGCPPVPPCPRWKEGAKHGFLLQNACRSLDGECFQSPCLAVRFEIQYFPDSSKSSFITCLGSRSDIHCVTCCKGLP